MPTVTIALDEYKDLIRTKELHGKGSIPKNSIKLLERCIELYGSSYIDRDRCSRLLRDIRDHLNIVERGFE